MISITLYRDIDLFVISLVWQQYAYIQKQVAVSNASAN